MLFWSMQTITVSATKARQGFFNMLLQVAAGKSFIVKKDNVEVARVTPINKGTDLAGLKKAMNALAVSGAFKNFDLTKSPLRNKQAKAWLKRIRNY